MWNKHEVLRLTLHCGGRRVGRITSSTLVHGFFTRWIVWLMLRGHLTPTLSWEEWPDDGE